MKKYTKRPVLASVAGTLGRNIPLVILLALSIGAAVVLGLLPPVVLEKIIDGLSGKTAVCDRLPAYGLLYFGLLAASGFAEGLRELFIVLLGQRIIREIREKMCAKLSRMPAGFFISEDPGDAVARIIGDVGTVETLFESGIIGMISDIISLVGIWCVVFSRCPGLGYLLLPVMAGVSLMTVAFQRRNLRAQKSNREALGKAGGILPETHANLRTIRSLHGEGFMFGRYIRILRESFDATERTNFCDAVYSPIVVMVSGAMTALVMVCAASGGETAELFGMTAGSAAAVIAYIGRIFGPIESIGMEIQNIQSASAGLGRIRAFLLADERVIPGVKEKENEEQCAAELKDVSFSYDGITYILNDFSMRVNPAEAVTLAGRTGVGKSTVLRLLLGLYAPEKGKIRIFGEDPAGIADERRRTVFGYVEQSLRQIPGTVGDQISLNDPRVTADMIENALKIAGLYDAVSSLPDGVNTPMREGLFSQGQLQLLSVARAIVLDPKLLLLDEITANLDSVTENALLGAIEASEGNRTIISVSHRLYSGLEKRKSSRLIQM